MCKIQIEQSYFRFSFSANADNNASRRLRPRATRRTKSLPRHILPGPPRHSASAGGPECRIYAELPPQIDARADEGQRRKKPRRRPNRLPARRPPLPPRHVPLRRQNTEAIACLAHGPRTSATRRTPLCRRRATPPPSHCSASPRTTRRPAVYRQHKRKRTAWLRTVGSGGRSASHGPDLRRARARRQTSSERFEKEVRVFVERGKIKFKTRRPHPPFYTQGAALRETRNPTVRRQSTVMSKTPAEPLRARAASPPSSDAFGTR
jgi:hypothetical protein